MTDPWTEPTRPPPADPEQPWTEGAAPPREVWAPIEPPSPSATGEPGWSGPSQHGPPGSPGPGPYGPYTSWGPTTGPPPHSPYGPHGPYGSYGPYGAYGPPGPARPGRARAVVVAVVAVLLCLGVLGVAVATSRVDERPSATMPGSDPFAVGRSVGVPLVDDTTVVLFTTAGVVAVDRHTHVLRWRVDPCVGPELADPVRRTFTATIVIRCGQSVRGLAVADGHEQWDIPVSGSIDRVRVSDEVVAVVTPERLEVFDARTGTSRWSRRNKDEVLPLAVDATHVYSGEENVLVALDAKTGVPSWWASLYTGWLHIDADGLFVRTSGHQLALVDPATGAIRWSTRGDDPRLSHSVIIGVSAGRVVVRNDDGDVHVFDTREARHVWSRPAQGRGVPGIGVSDGRLVVWGDGRVAVLDVADGRAVSTEAAAGAYIGVGAGALVLAGRQDVVIRDLP